MNWTEYFYFEPCSEGWEDFVIQMNENGSFESMNFDYFRTSHLWWAFDMLISDNHAKFVKAELQRRGEDLLQDDDLFYRWERLND